MLKPAGMKGSPNHHHVVLMNWARLRKVDIGLEGYAGWAMYVGSAPAFVVEHRGPGHSQFRKVYPFGDDRGEAFAQAQAVYRRMSGQP